MFSTALHTAGRFTFIDLFAGIGGFRLAFERVGANCVFSSEWNRYACQTYQANFGDIPHGDITRIPVSEIPDHDVLTAGFPCQPFSIAGVSKKNALKLPHGFQDITQGTLFFNLASIIEYHRPKAFILENVKNLVNHDKGNTFRVILSTLREELGYHVQFRVIDARPWVPQHRERILIVGFREKNGFSLNSLPIPDPLAGPKLRTILHPEDGSERPEKPYTIGALAQVSPKYSLTDHLWGYLQEYAEKHRKKGNGFGYGIVGPEDTARTLSARYFKDGSEILVRQDGKNPRRLTPRECARLMGFDTPGQAPFRIPVSDTQAYKQFGNAVVVPVIESAARHMAPWILSNPEPDQETEKQMAFG
jgi:DNA (cytosine-5)-methyltransferase 1